MPGKDNVKHFTKLHGRTMTNSPMFLGFPSATTGKSRITPPKLHATLGKDVNFKLSTKRQRALRQKKKYFSNAVTLSLPTNDGRFVLSTSDSIVGSFGVVN